MAFSFTVFTSSIISIFQSYPLTFWRPIYVYLPVVHSIWKFVGWKFDRYIRIHKNPEIHNFDSDFVFLLYWKICELTKWTLLLGKATFYKDCFESVSIILHFKSYCINFSCIQNRLFIYRQSHPHKAQLFKLFEKFHR